ncbi:hypothetical protein SAMN05421507_13920 [Lentzea jiangxiensis]|uniref:Tryptophan-associated transmembrane protein (Trp_oprn_chp) n=1 Tax=Lentzea jiangxiensis TaxID=641025 RepID=A0A1H0X667_9PSEU|nr:hypothetical protein SAMN05421507_1138 [Lentzea jiangxiensis]SDP98433.1 hypothetical protein SAMN05421507_13920 [Lentzea jiangxiensis]
MLSVLGAGTVVAGSLLDTFRTVHKGFEVELVITTSAWVTRSEPPSGPPENPALFAAGWPLVVCAVVVACAVVLTLRERTAFVGRVLVLGAAGALAGVVFLYLALVERQRSLYSFGPSGEPAAEVHYLGGTWMLVLGAIITLVGAVLAQQRVGSASVDEDGVVVRSLGGEDDTPPFGIAVPGDGREAR